MMQFRNSRESYGIIAQVLHWLTAALVFAQIGLGLYAASLPVSLARLQWLSHHKSLGFTVLGVVLLRLIWRRIDAPPALPDAMPRWERHVALVVHRALYLLLVLVALTGWLYASAAGLSASWFGFLSVPDLIPRNTDLSPVLKELHKGSVAMLALLVIVHIGAAARHGFILRDSMALRMLPIGRRSKD